jgi:hypothetical protein
MIYRTGIETPSAAARSAGQAPDYLTTNEHPLQGSGTHGATMQRQIGPEALVAQLQTVIHDVLRQVLPPGPLCLVDYPNHSNVGDSAI